MCEGLILATHSQLGLLAWPLEGREDEPAASLLPDLTRGATAVREVQAVAGRAWFTVDETLWSLGMAGKDLPSPVPYAGSTALLSALSVTPERAYAGNVDGRVFAWDLGEPGSGRVVRGATGGPVESVDVVDVGGVDHLIIADRRAGLTALAVEDSYSRQYDSGVQVIRRAAAADDLLVAMNDNRDRVLVWDPRTPGRLMATIVIPHLTGQTVQDICLVP
jgi:hypothetical protein